MIRFVFSIIKLNEFIDYDFKSNKQSLFEVIRQENDFPPIKFLLVKLSAYRHFRLLTLPNSPFLSLITPITDRLRHTISHELHSNYTISIRFNP